MSELSKIRCFLLDMDGTFYLGNQLIPGALEFLKTLQEQNKNFLFLTNNSSKANTDYVEKLGAMGCNVRPEDVFTSGEATAIYLKNQNHGDKLMVLGTPSLEEEFRKAGFQLVNHTSQRPDYVVLGFDQTLTYDKLWHACDWLREGVEYIATHPDFNCPLENGRYMPDTGSIIEMIKASTGRVPYVVGKPNPGIIEAVMQKYGYQKSELAIVGDRLYTDIKTGENAGIASILVLSGETDMKTYQAGSVKATYIFDSIKEMNQELRDEYGRY